MAQRQGIFLVLVKGGLGYIQLYIYNHPTGSIFTTYIPLDCLVGTYNPYYLFPEPEKSVDNSFSKEKNPGAKLH